MKPVAETQRLLLRRVDPADAPFVRDLVNDPAWIRYIGEKGVKTLADAQRYIETALMAMYERYGFGLYLVHLKALDAPIGICGLIKRDALEDVDLGFAFMPQFRGHGYAYEAASAVMAYGRGALGLGRIVAILASDNDRSSRLLGKLGFRPEGRVTLPPKGETLELYAAAAP